jgi:predicted aspartyl protease
MGTFRVSCILQNHVRPKRSARVRRLLVDTGRDYTWVPQAVLERIGVGEQKRDEAFTMANGQVITRSVGFAIIRVDGHFTIDEVVFAQRGDLALLGARSLDGLNLRVDPKNRRLGAGGPLLAG